MKIRMLSVFMIVLLTLGSGIQAGPIAGCMDHAPMMGMADNVPADAERHCDETGRASVDAGMSCHGICMAPLVLPDIARAHVAAARIVVPHQSVAWRDTAFSPDPHPPRPISHI
jgi:hypothetical protein